MPVRPWSLDLGPEALSTSPRRFTIIVLSRGTCSERAPPVGAWGRRRFQGRAEGRVGSNRFEVRIASGEGAVFRVERDRTLEVRDRFGVLAALGVRDREHVERVIVVGIFVAHEAQVHDRLIVLAAVDGERRRVEPFFDGLRRGLAGRDLAPADVEIQPHALVQLFFFRVLAQHRFEDVLGAAVIVMLERLEAAFVQRHRLEVGRSALRRGLGRLAPGRGGLEASAAADTTHAAHEASGRGGR